MPRTARSEVAQRLEFLVGRGGLEPPTSRLSGVRSNHLSYRPTCRPLRGKTFRWKVLRHVPRAARPEVAHTAVTNPRLLCL